MKLFHATYRRQRRAALKHLLLGSLVISLTLSMNGCQSVWRASGEKFKAEYSLKKRKSNITCLTPYSVQPVIKPLPLKVSWQQMNEFSTSLNAALGARYRSGGADMDGFDCSGLVQYLYKQHFGMILPRMSWELAVFGDMVTGTSLHYGDLLFFSMDGYRIDHVGISIGGSRFVHAASNGVRINDLADAYYHYRYAFTARIITTQ